MTEKTGVMICGHGSRDVEATTEFASLARHLRERLPQYAVESGYLEFARPIIRDGLEALKAQGVTRVLAVPGMLFAAGHVKNDLPWEINSFAAENPGMSITFGREGHSRKNLIYLALLLIAICNTHAIGAIAVFSNGIYALGLILIRPRAERPLKTWLLIYGLAAVCAVPWIVNGMMHDANLDGWESFRHFLVALSTMAIGPIAFHDALLRVAGALIWLGIVAFGLADRRAVGTCGRDRPVSCRGRSENRSACRRSSTSRGTRSPAGSYRGSSVS